MKSSAKQVVAAIYTYAWSTALLALLFWLMWYSVEFNAPPTPYAGKIVEKSHHVYETDYGSLLEHVLIVETATGQQRRVVVAQTVFDRATIGMQISQTLAYDTPTLTP